MLKKVIF